MIGCPTQAEVITFDQSPYEISVAQGYNHVPIRIQIPDGLTPTLVYSDEDWTQPELDINRGEVVVKVSTASMTEDHVANVRLLYPDGFHELTLNATVSPLDILRLVDDPTRPVVYGIHRNRAELGCIVRHDQFDNRPLDCLTISKAPTDMVLDDVSNELLVISPVERRIDVVDLEAFQIKSRIPLTEFNIVGFFDREDSSSNIDLGPGGKVCYIDAARRSFLRVLDRASKEVLQTLVFDASIPSNSSGFLDIAFSPDKSTMFALPQHSSLDSYDTIIASYSVTPDGLLSPQGTFEAPGSETLSRMPYEVPIFVSKDGTKVIANNMVVNAETMDQVLGTFPSVIWATTPNAEWVATHQAIYNLQTGERLFVFNDPTFFQIKDENEVAPQVFTTDYSRFLFFDRDDGQMKSVNLMDDLYDSTGQGELTPLDGSVIRSPASLEWPSYLGIDTYDVYLGFSKESVEASNTQSPEYLGRVLGNHLDLAGALETGKTYYWRVDPVSTFGPITGVMRRFTVSRVDLIPSSIRLIGVQGNSHLDATLDLSSVSVYPWEISSETPWIHFPIVKGATPDNIPVVLDGSVLPVGTHTGEIKLQVADEMITIPVELEIIELAIKQLKSDRRSGLVYAISEIEYQPAYLLEMDAVKEEISRIVEVGTSVTDFAIHDGENRIYVTNWLPGLLHSIDLASFQLVKTFEFEPYQSSLTDEDVFQVSAGGVGRLVLEGYRGFKQIRLVETQNGELLDGAYRYSGGGMESADGRYYYHGDQGLSNASLVRYDLSGDQFFKLRDIRPDGIPTFGDRNVVMSESETSIFWATMVFDADLNVTGQLPEIILSTTQTGRYAMSRNWVYDVVSGEAVLTMPANYTASAYNTTAEKLVVASGSSIGFYPLSENAPLTLLPPILSVENVDPSDIALTWVDRSLESGFEIQYQPVGATSWFELPPIIGANVTSTLVTGGEEGIEYIFRIRAVRGELHSDWSELVSNATKLTPPPLPLAQIQTANPMDLVISWVPLNTYLMHFEHKVFNDEGEYEWQEVGTVNASSGSATIQPLQPDTLYEFRLRSGQEGRFSDYAYLSGRTLSLPPPRQPTFSDVKTYGSPSLLVEWELGEFADVHILYVRVFGDEKFIPLITLSEGLNFFFHEGLDPDVFYEYQLLAVNKVGSTFSEISGPWSASTRVVLQDDFDSGPNPGAWDVLEGVDNEPGGRNGSTDAQFFSGLLRTMETKPFELHSFIEIEFDMRLPSFFDEDLSWWPTPKETQVYVEIHDGTEWIQLTHLSTTVSLPGWQHYRTTFNPSKMIPDARIRWIQRENGPTGNRWGLDNVQVVMQPLAPPDIPNSPTIGEGDDGKYVVFWLAADRADTYLLQRSLDEGKSWEFIGSTSNVLFTDQDLHLGARVGYRVTAQNTTGISDPSEPAWIGESSGGGGIENTITVTGRVFFMGKSGRPIAGAAVTLTQDGTEHHTVSDALGNYAFEVPTGMPIEIRADLVGFSKPSRGVDVADIIGLRKHILNRSKFLNSIEWVAADANRDGSIDISDIVQMRKVILNRDDAFSKDDQGRKHSIWRLICAEFIGVKAESAFAELPNYTVCRYEQVTADILNADFAAIKLGDSNGDWNWEGE